MSKQVLESIEKGNQILIGSFICTVLDHSEEGTAITTCFPVKEMKFGKTCDYLKSEVREFCNGDFYKVLVNAVGKDNIIPHKVNLACDDDSNKDKTCIDNVSIFTNEDYQRYRKLLPAIVDKASWTATSIGNRTLNIGGKTPLDVYNRYICYVSYEGMLVWRSCSSCYGVRPFFVLNSSILVDAVDS